MIELLLLFATGFVFVPLAPMYHLNDGLVALVQTLMGVDVPLAMNCVGLTDVICGGLQTLTVAAALSA